MLTSISSSEMGRKDARRPTKAPVASVDFPGGAEARVDGGEEARRQQAVAGDGEQDAGLAEHGDQQHRGDAGDAGQGDDELRPAQADAPEGVGDRCGDVELGVGHHAGDHRHDGDVEHGAQQQRGDEGDRHVSLRPPRLLGLGRHRVESDVGEKGKGGAGEHAGGLAAVGVAAQVATEQVEAGVAVGRERVPVGAGSMAVSLRCTVNTSWPIRDEEHLGTRRKIYLRRSSPASASGGSATARGPAICSRRRWSWGSATDASAAC
jgi:hypothetical protein